VDKVAVEFIKLQGELGQRVRQVAAAFDIGLDRQQHVLHALVFVAAPDDVECLHQRHAGTHHCGELTAEDGDVAGFDRFAAAEQGFGLLADLKGIDPLAAQAGFDQRDVASRGFAFDFFAPLVGAFPDKYGLLQRFCCHGGQSFVTRLISSRLVSPSLTFLRPD